MSMDPRTRALLEAPIAPTASLPRTPIFAK